MEVQTSATALPRVMRRMLPKTSYRDRMELAKELADAGYGYEDLMVTLNISWRDARYIVFGRV